MDSEEQGEGWRQSWGLLQVKKAPEVLGVWSSELQLFGGTSCLENVQTTALVCSVQKECPSSCVGLEVCPAMPSLSNQGRTRLE